MANTTLSKDEILDAIGGMSVIELTDSTIYNNTTNKTTD